MIKFILIAVAMYSSLLASVTEDEILSMLVKKLEYESPENDFKSEYEQKQYETFLLKNKKFLDSTYKRNSCYG